MSRTREDLISALSTDLKPVRPVINIDRLALAWLLGSALYVMAITHLLGPIRPNALQQLATEPRFLLETFSGVVAIVMAALVAFRAAIPGALSRRFATFGSLFLILWIANYVVGLVSPALEPSMLGKRHFCVWETLGFSVPPLIVGYLLTRRLHPLQPVRAAMACALAAGLLPALYMQIACMYIPSHILKFHIVPGFLMMIVGAAIGWMFRPRRG